MKILQITHLNKGMKSTGNDKYMSKYKREWRRKHTNPNYKEAGVDVK